MRKTARLALLLLLLACPGVARAAWSNDPAVNTDVTSVGTDAWYHDSHVASDGAGGLYVSWTQSPGAGTTGLDLRLQHLDARGARLWPTDYAITVPRDQITPVLLPDGAGGVFLVWRDIVTGSYALGMQRVTSAGVALWGPEGKVLADGTSYGDEIALTPDGAGGFYCVWTNVVTYDVYAQRVNASGDRLWSASGVTVCAEAHAQVAPRATTTSDGGLCVLWVDFRKPSANSYGTLFAQHLDRQGVPSWTADGVDLGTGLIYTAPRVFADAESGVVFAWLELTYAVGVSFRAQRLGADGSPQWGVNGVQLAVPSKTSTSFGAGFDASQHLVVAWADTLPGQYLTRAQRLDLSGVAQWTAGGRIVHSSPTVWRTPSDVVALADGSCWIAVYGFVTAVELSALHVAENGTPATATPVLVCSGPGQLELAQALPDGAGGVLFETMPWGNGVRPRAQRVDRWGQLGVQPNLTQVIDAPDDQGGYVHATWTKSPLDTPPSAGVNKYRFWREVPTLAAQARAMRGARVLREGDDVPDSGVPALLQLTSANGSSEYWEYVGEMLADGRATYTASIATASDSVPGANPATRFMIEGRRGDGTQWWFSDPMSGSSADNLAPESPASFFAVWASGQSKLHWPKSLEADFKEYRIYAGDWPNFTPSPSNLVATVSDTGYTHAAAHPTGYKIVAVDVHGNVSAARWTAPSGTTGVDDALPVAFAFSPVSPNPVRGEAALRFALPVEGRVTLAVYDAQGRRVRLLADATLPAGEHTLRWEGDDDAGRALAAGLYFVRLEAAGRTRVRRCVVAP